MKRKYVFFAVLVCCLFLQGCAVWEIEKSLELTVEDYAVERNGNQTVLTSVTLDNDSHRYDYNHIELVVRNEQTGWSKTVTVNGSIESNSTKTFQMRKNLGNVPPGQLMIHVK